MAEFVKGMTLQRRIASVWLALISAAVSVAYLVPGWGTPIPPPGKVSVISYIAYLGPYWTVGFGLCAVLIVGALATGHSPLAGHLTGLSVTVGYAVALWYGALAGHPVGPFAGPILTTGYAIGHLFIFISYLTRKDEVKWPTQPLPPK